MDNKIICKCPKCGSNIVDGRFAYECEHLHEDNGCDFKFSKVFFGVDITEVIIESICKGETTEQFTFIKPDKSWKARLKYSDSEGRVIFEFDKPKFEYIATCPCCNKRVKETDKFYMCEDYKHPCTFIIGKDLRGHKVTKDEVIKLINGETLPEQEFTWKSGKTGKAKYKLSSEGKIEFIFD